MIKMKTRINHDISNIQLTELTELSVLILSGINLANIARNILNSCVNFYCKLNYPLNKSAVILLGDLMNYLKKIQVLNSEQIKIACQNEKIRKFSYNPESV